MRKLAIGVVVGAVVIAILFLAVPREPIDRFPGTRLTGDVVTDARPDWSFLEGSNLIFVEVTPWYGLAHSVTTTSWVMDRELYVPCRTCAEKHWAAVVEGNPHVRLKIEDKVYERTAVRIIDEVERRRLLRIPAGEPLPDVAVFHMAARRH